MEAVQRFALKMVTHRWDLGYNDLLKIVDIPKLEKRRLYLKLIQVFKIVHGLCYFTPDIFEQRVSRTQSDWQDPTPSNVPMPVPTATIIHLSQVV